MLEDRNRETHRVPCPTLPSVPHDGAMLRDTDRGRRTSAAQQSSVEDDEVVLFLERLGLRVALSH